MISQNIRANAIRVARDAILRDDADRQRDLRAIAGALGCQDPDAVLCHLNPRVVESRMADLLVEAVIEAMEDAHAMA
jgi:hypothetical protein